MTPIYFKSSGLSQNIWWNVDVKYHIITGAFRLIVSGAAASCWRGRASSQTGSSSPVWPRTRTSQTAAAPKLRGPVSSPRPGPATWPTRTSESRYLPTDLQPSVLPPSHLSGDKHHLTSTSCLRVSGSFPAGRFHHHGGPEVAALLPHLHLSLPLLLDALRYDLVVVGLRSRRSGTP